MDDFAENAASAGSRFGSPEFATISSARSEFNSSRKPRFRASRYQFNLKSLFWLFTFCSFVCLALSAIPTGDRAAAGMTIAEAACLAIYAFALLSWIPDYAAMVFFASVPVALIAIAVLMANVLS